MTRHSVAIAGAGPAGLASALLLHRAGHRVTIFDRFEAPRPIGSGLMLQPTGQAVLARLGLLDGVHGRAAPIVRLQGTECERDRTVLDVRYDALAGEAKGFGIHRGALFGLLYEAVLKEGVTLEAACEVTDFEAQGSGGRFVLAGGRRTAAFDLAIDAAGARSPLAKRADGYRFRELEWGALWASLGWRDGLPEDTLSQRYRKASVMIGVLPVGSVAAGAERQAALFWSLKPAQVEALKLQGLGRWKDHVASLWPAAIPYLEQIADWEQLTLARYGHHTLATPAGRGIVHVGDSAHSTSPQLGQGANMALLDAHVLAQALERFADVEQALQEYCRKRRLHVRLYQALSLFFTPFYQSDNPVLPWLRDGIMALASRVPPGPSLLASLVAGGWGSPAIEPTQPAAILSRQMM